MSIGAVALNSKALPVPAGYQVRVEYLGAPTKLADGSIRRDLVNSTGVRRYTLVWNALTEDDKDDIEDAYDDAVAGDVALTLPDSTSDTVTAKPSPSLQFEAYHSGGVLRYRVTMELWEQ
jgi:hypothetical protein